MQRWEHFIPPTEEPINIKASKGLSIFNAGSTSSHRHRNQYTSKQAKVYRYPTLGALHPTNRGTYTHQNKQRFIDIQHWEHFIPQRNQYTSKQAKVYWYPTLGALHPTDRGTCTHQNKKRFINIQHWEHFIPQRNLYTSKQAQVYRYLTLGVLHPTEELTYTSVWHWRSVNLARLHKQVLDGARKLTFTVHLPNTKISLSSSCITDLWRFHLRWSSTRTLQLPWTRLTSFSTIGCPND